MGPPLTVRIGILKEAKLELLSRALKGVDVAKELEHVEAKLSKYGRLSREYKKKQKKSN